MIAFLRAAGQLAFFFALLSGRAAAQSFNVDLGDAAVPSRTYGGAAGQPGLWNVVLPASEGEEGSQALLDLGAERSAVRVAQWGVSAWTQCPAGLMGDAKGLLEDAALSLKGTQRWSFHGLRDGDYLVYTYAWPGCLAEPGKVLVLESPDSASCCGDYGVSGWSGHHIVGQSFALHRARVQGGDLNVLLETGDGSAGARMCGMQLVWLGPLGAPDPIFAGRLVVRSSANGTSLVLSGLDPGEAAPLWARPADRRGLPIQGPDPAQLIALPAPGETRRVRLPELPPGAAGALAGLGWKLEWWGHRDAAELDWRS